MRKPLVVVCVAASALLLTGGIAATSASAEDTPDVPGLPGFSMPDFLTWPNFTDDSDAGDSDAGDSDVGDSDVGDSTSDDSTDQDISGTDDDSAPDAAAPAPVREHPAVQHPATVQHPAAAQHPASVQRPHAAAPAHVRPEAPTFAQRNGGSTLFAAARRDVTAADVSSSPGAPVQQQILALVNLNRRRGGCGDLSIDRRLIDAANEHAADMARRDYFAHQSPNGDGAGDRVRDQGYRWKRYGENLARGVDSAYDVVDGWMHSPEHRENIMDCRLDQMGVGLAIARDHTAYWVQDFATPMT